MASFLTQDRSRKVITVRLSSRIRALVALASLSLVLTPAAADARGLPGHPRAGTHWLVGQLGPDHLMPSPYGGADIGLSIDSLFQLASYRSTSSTVDDLGSAIESAYWGTYLQYGGVFYANSAAKALVAARVLRRPARSFGGHDLRRKVLSMVAPRRAGLERGRVRDSDWRSAKDYSNTLGQSFAVIGLARSGGVPQRVVDYLLRQQCRGGGFTITETRGKTCAQAGSHGSVDATGLALQALVAARKHGAAVPGRAIRRAAHWLVSVQHSNGGFAESGGAGRPNTNSTGYAAAGLAAVHRDRPVRRAARFVAGLQLTSATAGSASADIGAIAYDRPAFLDAVASGVTSSTRDQFRRSTAQALFALTGRHLDILHRR